MMLATLVVTALAYWDEERESRAALDDFAQEQSRLAKGVSSALSARLTALQGEVLALGGAASATTSARPSDFEMHVRGFKSPPFPTPEDGATFRLSVPLSSLRIFPWCLTTISSGINRNPNITIGVLWATKWNPNSGNDAEATIDASETYLVKANTATNTSRIASPDGQVSARNTPSALATPLPPRNSSHTGYTCPITAATAAATAKS